LDNRALILMTLGSVARYFPSRFNRHLARLTVSNRNLGRSDSGMKGSLTDSPPYSRSHKIMRYGSEFLASGYFSSIFATCSFIVDKRLATVSFNSVFPKLSGLLLSVKGSRSGICYTNH